MFRSRWQRLGWQAGGRLGGALLLAASLSGCSGMMAAFGGALPRELEERGVAAEAEVVALWDTGWTVNDDPVVGMKVRVHPSASEPYEATIEKTLVSRIATWQFQPGTVIPVRYDPENPEVVAVDREPRSAEADPPLLGVILRPAKASERYGGPGVIVEGVIKGSPADEAGFASGDLLTAIDGEPIADVFTVPAKLRARARRSVRFDVLRGDQTLSLTATLTSGG